MKRFVRRVVAWSVLGVLVPLRAETMERVTRTKGSKWRPIANKRAS